ncbi:MAG: ubiquinone/menaquinone biosynthesis methyltransferase [Acidobacteria bacterium]|nr:ubiquinone/menaquinone biosynthesis methyltransferase [Acidobacteriota bacterium]
MSLDAAFATPEARARHVRRLFATIADRYDLVTRVLSYGMDGRWKRRLIALAEVVPGERALDLASGTGDLALALAAEGARVVGLDVTPRMLQLAAAKTPASPSAALTWTVGDMAALPCPSQAFSLVTTSYGLRNVPDLETAIDEIVRVLTPGGRFLSLDFNRPSHALVRAAYLGYLSAVGATLGWLLHRDPDAYRYIPASIRRYPGAAGVADRLRARGFADVQIVPVLWGLMTIHVARRPRAPEPLTLLSQRSETCLAGLTALGEARRACSLAQVGAGLTSDASRRFALDRSRAQRRRRAGAPRGREALCGRCRWPG